jgi:hypothetical protein
MMVLSRKMLALDAGLQGPRIAWIIIMDDIFFMSSRKTIHYVLDDTLLMQFGFCRTGGWLG